MQYKEDYAIFTFLDFLTQIQTTMKTEQRQWTQSGGWETKTDEGLGDLANLVFVFGSRPVLSDGQHFNEIKQVYPNAQILTCTTSGEIMDTEVNDDTVAVTAVHFENTKLKFAELNIDEVGDSFKAGTQLAGELDADDLATIFVLSDGIKVNGSELVKGFNDSLGKKIPVTGGLAGDAANFEKTLVGIGTAPKEGMVAAVGLYGDNIKVGYGSRGGWDSFGPLRTVTKSKSNVLHELDGQSALALYKTYLGDKADELPGSGLLFPLSIREKEGDEAVVRTLLAIDENEQSMTFAGDIPEGSTAQLMKANFDKLIDGAYDAAEKTAEKVDAGAADLAILVSCVGRKLVLGQRIEEEVEEVRDVLGEKATITGFYSYGEISPLTPNVNCELHNQTMTITTLTEN